jgi:hypothetical protein
MTDTRQISPGEYRPRNDGHGYTAIEVRPYIRRNGGESQLVLWRGKCVHCGAAFDVQGGGNVEKLAKTCEQHRGMRRPRAGKPSRAGTATLLRCVRLMLAPAIQQLSEGRTEGALEHLRAIAAMLKPQKGGRNASA